MYISYNTPTNVNTKFFWEGGGPGGGSSRFSLLLNIFPREGCTGSTSARRLHPAIFQQHGHFLFQSGTHSTPLL